MANGSRSPWLLSLSLGIPRAHVDRAITATLAYNVRHTQERCSSKSVFLHEDASHSMRIRCRLEETTIEALVFLLLTVYNRPWCWQRSG